MYTGVGRISSAKYREVQTTTNRPTTAKAGILKKKGLESIYSSTQNLAPDKTFQQFMKYSTKIHNALLAQDETYD
jgi:hypothetical protein